MTVSVPSGAPTAIRRALVPANVIDAAEIALKKIAPHIVVFMAVELESHRSEDFQAFERAVQPLEEIVASGKVPAQRLLDGLHIPLM